MVRITLVLCVFICLSSFLFAEDDVEKLLGEFKEKLSKTEKSSPEYQKVFKVYKLKFEDLKSKATETYQFDKSKKIKLILASIDDGETNISYSAAKVEGKKEEVVTKKVVIPPFIKTTFSEGLTDKDGKPVTTEQLAGKYIGIYFSAHWCGPCRAFTPKLVKFRDENEKEFEVVFVSSDESESKRKEYMTEANMKWLAAKFKGENGKDLNKKYTVDGIPTLIILSPSGELVTEDGRGDVTNNYDSALKDWKKMKN